MPSKRRGARKRKQAKPRKIRSTIFRRAFWRRLHLSAPRLPTGFWRSLAPTVGFLLAAFGLLSLLAPTSGALSQAMAQFLRRLFGWAAYLLPPALAAAAYWLGLRRRTLDITRCTGSLLLLLSLLTLTHLAARLPNPFALSVAGYGGGFLGWGVSSVLMREVGRVGAYLFSLTLLFIAGLLTFDLPPARLARHSILSPLAGQHSQRLAARRACRTSATPRYFSWITWRSNSQNSVSIADCSSTLK